MATVGKPEHWKKFLARVTRKFEEAEAAGLEIVGVFSGWDLDIPFDPAYGEPLAFEMFTCE